MYFKKNDSKIVNDNFVFYEYRNRALKKIIIFTLVSYINIRKFLFVVYYGTETSYLISMDYLYQAVGGGF